MIKLFREWYGRHFSDPQKLTLLLLIGLGLALALFIGDILAPLLVSILLAYILEGLIRTLEEARMPRLFSFLLVYVLFVATLLLLLLRLVPLLSEQIVDLAARLPSMVAAGQRWVESLPDLYPELVSPIQVEQILTTVRAEVLAFADEIIRFSLDTVVDVLSIVVYTVVVPILVFFLLKDKRRILDWAKTYLPAPQSLSSQVWGEMDLKVSQYLRGKLIEIGVVWVATFFAFALFGLQYALLLSFLVGLSVIIPYVGAVVVTVPVMLVAAFQWGLSPEFAYLMLAYLVIQFLDGNLLVPLLFSEAVNLHPAAILTAILVFGGFWGVWGVLFAIPLASLIDVVLRSWPRAAPD